ncbi:hypothetical protein I601_1750 [Nocardioides dokdonensis FR1436]|uniref:Uncharacterized protein n=1 Tax=Nocardioides dokdonensis FR1436 TaxID=1300347 RepID=A0A1A9GL39_9ACTN|nr:hypothetical protein [Nocardioides dokdonensis]ANH38181.1 hypothetical protein I601_1750 [Nocardioides dokdonensis FR1436]
MKKILAASIGAALLVPIAATSASAQYSSNNTDVAFKAPRKVQVGETIKVRVKANTFGDAGSHCTGDFVLIVKNQDREIVKQARKPVRNRETFSFKLRHKDVYRVAVKYERGENDSCGTSRTARDLRVVKRMA